MHDDRVNTHDGDGDSDGRADDNDDDVVSGVDVVSGGASVSACDGSDDATVDDDDDEEDASDEVAVVAASLIAAVADEESDVDSDVSDEVWMRPSAVHRSHVLLLCVAQHPHLSALHASLRRQWMIFALAMVVYVDGNALAAHTSCMTMRSTRIMVMV